MGETIKIWWFKYLVTRYVHQADKNFHCKSIKMLSLYYHELLVNIQGHEGKISLIIHDYMLNKVLNKIKEMLDN